MKIRYLFLLIVPFFLYGCYNAETGSNEKLKFKVGLVFDVGGRGDKSFNDLAYAGLERGKKELDIYTEYIELSSNVDRESALRIFASRKFDLIFGIGFMFTDDITNLAREFPDTKFACVDYSVGTEIDIPDNLVALKFREEEGAFLVGAIAGLVSKTDIIGFIGGMDIPLIHKFEAGYTIGAKKVKPNCKVISAYAGVTGEAFKNPSKGKELAISQYKNGVDIIFHASGSTGLGVFEAARNMKKFAIGVDADQYKEAPGNILTSMIKRIDVAVFNTISDALSGDFKGGIMNLGLKENGLGYVYDDNNKAVIPIAVIEQIEELKKDIIAGKIKIPVK